MSDRTYIYRVVACFCLGWAVLYADRTVLYPMLDIIGRDFQLSGAQTGLITSAYFTLYVAMQIPTGILGDRYGLKKILMVSYFLAGVGLLCVGLFAREYFFLLMFVALHGIGAGSFYPAAYGITMATVPTSMRGFSSALVNTGMSMGLALGLAMSGPLYIATQNWRMPFLILAVPTLCLPFLFWRVLKDPPSLPKVRLPLAVIAKNSHFMRINGAVFCSMYGFWVAVTWGPTFFQTERGLGLEITGLFVAVTAIAAIPAALFLGRLSDRIGRKKISLVIIPISALTIAMMAYVDSLPLLLVALILYGLVGKLAWDPVVVAWTGDFASLYHPQSLGTIIGVYNFSGMLSSITAPLFSGIIRDVTGSLVGAFYVGAAMVFLAFFLLLGVPEVQEAKANLKKKEEAEEKILKQ